MKTFLKNAFLAFSAMTFATVLFLTFRTAYEGDVAYALVQSMVTVPLSLIGFYTLRTYFENFENQTA